MGGGSGSGEEQIGSRDILEKVKKIPARDLYVFYLPSLKVWGGGV